MIKVRSVYLKQLIRDPLPGDMTQKRGDGKLFFTWNASPHESSIPNWTPVVMPYVLERGLYAGWVLLVAKSTPARAGTEVLVPPHMIESLEPWDPKGTDAWAEIDTHGATVADLGPRIEAPKTAPALKAAK